jgi:L-amino acid N-acyltransferase YncA
MLELLASIKTTNLKSIAFFERAGFGSPREYMVGETASVEYRYPLKLEKK